MSLDIIFRTFKDKLSGSVSHAMFAAGIVLPLLIIACGERPKPAGERRQEPKGVDSRQKVGPAGDSDSALGGFRGSDMPLTPEKYANVDSPEEALKNLEELNIPYTPEEFLRRAGQADIAAVRLFLAAGMDPDGRVAYDRDRFVMGLERGAFSMSIMKTTALMRAASGGCPQFFFDSPEERADSVKGDLLRKESAVPETFRRLRLRKIKVMNILLDAGADIDAVDAQGETALFHVAKYGTIDILLPLLERGANTSVKNNDGHTVLIKAIVEGRPDSVLKMLEQGVSPAVKGNRKEASLFETALRGNTEDVLTFLNEGINPDAQTEEGFTALMAASGMGHKEIVSALLDRGANVNAKDSGTLSPVIIAAHVGNRETVRLLLEGGADPNATCEYGSVLTAARSSGDLAIVRDVIEKGADVNVKNKIGMTPLMFAVAQRTTSMAELFVQNGARLDEADKFGKTALMHAAEYGGPDVVHFLLANGANINAKDNDGKTALMYAQRKDLTAIVQLLKNAGAEE